MFPAYAGMNRPRNSGAAAWMGVPRACGDEAFEGVGGTIWEPGNTVNGYRTEITNQINAGDVLMGNFADLVVLMWGDMELNVDPYRNSKSGRLRIITFQDIDLVVRRTESFCLGRKG